MHFSVSGHVTLGMVRWRHELIHISSLWLLSQFGPVEAHMCSVIANWFFPSNGIKRYFNGPLKLHHSQILGKHSDSVTLASVLKNVFSCSLRSLERFRLILWFATVLYPFHFRSISVLYPFFTRSLPVPLAFLYPFCIRSVPVHKRVPC